MNVYEEMERLVKKIREIERQIREDKKVIEADLESYREFRYKQIDAFEVIKSKQVDIGDLLAAEKTEDYNAKWKSHWLGILGNLTYEEFRLLKEMLLS